MQSRNSDKIHNILLWRAQIWESKVSNTGDLAITLNTIRKIKAQIPTAKIHMFSDDPTYVQDRYGIQAYPISQVFNPIRLYQIIKKMDLIILGGGTILQDNYFIGVIPINLSVGLIAKSLGIKVACNSIGVASESEITSLGKLLSIFGLRRFDSITVRDPESKWLIDKWTGGKIPVTVTSDMAVDLLPVDFEQLSPSLTEEGINLCENRTVAIAARKIFHHEKGLLSFIPSGLRVKYGVMSRLYKRRIDEFKKALAELCDYIIDKYNVRVLFIPFYSSGGNVDSDNISTPRRVFASRDNKFAEQVYEFIQHKQAVTILQRNYQAEEITAIIAKCYALIGVPYHSLVLASSQNVPVIGIGYVSKVERYMKMLGLDDYIIPARIEDGVAANELKDKFDQLWQNRPSIIRQLENKKHELSRLADLNISILKELLEDN